MDMRKHSLRRSGLFSEPAYLAVGDPYQDRKEGKDPRRSGNQMITTVSKKGKTWKNTFFTKPGRLFEGDESISYEMLQKRWHKEKSQKLVGGTPWRPANPSKKNSGSGDFLGTLGGKVEYITPKVEGRLSKEDVVQKPPNITTNPGKKGSYGMYGTHFGYHKGYKGAAGEFSYVADPVPAPKRKPPPADDAPPAFRPASASKSGLSGYFGKVEYIPQGAPRPLTAGVKPEGDERAAFRPGGGRVKTLDKSLPYIEDPYERKVQLAKDAWKDHNDKVAGRPAFIGKSAETHTAPVRSVFKMNIRV